MAIRPYQEKVDQFLADYQDKFLPTLVTGKGTPESTDTTAAIPMTKEQAQVERDKILAASIHPDTFNKVLDVMKGGTTIPSRQVGLGTPASQFSGSLEGQRIMGERAIPIPHVSTGFTTPTGGGTLAEVMASTPNELLRGRNDVIDMKPGPSGTFEANKPVPSDGWDWRGELAKQGSWSVGPERFFFGGEEKWPGYAGAVSGDQLARERILRESGGSAIPLSYIGESPIPMRRSEVPGYEMPGEIKTALQGIQKILMQPSGAIYSPSGRQVFAGGYRKGQERALEGLAGTYEKLAGVGAGYQTKMAEIEAEKPYREAMADYYRRMAGVHEAAIPSEAFSRYGAGMHALAEAERPHAFPPNSAVYQGSKLLGYVPEKPEAIHPIIRDIINRSEMVDPTTGMKTGGFDIRGARQKIGYLAPWLKSQGVEIPKEAYKMTKPEFLAEQKAFIAKLSKKERTKYTPQYTEKLWSEYWGD